MSNHEAYQGLIDAGVHWDRLAHNKLRVYMSNDGNGSHHKNLDLIKAYLEKAEMFEFNRSFDPICGKGFSDFKHKCEAPK